MVLLAVPAVRQQNSMSTTSPFCVNLSELLFLYQEKKSQKGEVAQCNFRRIDYGRST